MLVLQVERLACWAFILDDKELPGLVHGDPAVGSKCVILILARAPFERLIDCSCHLFSLLQGAAGHEGSAGPGHLWRRQDHLRRVPADLRPKSDRGV